MVSAIYDRLATFAVESFLQAQGPIVNAGLKRMMLSINEDGDAFCFGEVTYLRQGFLNLFAWWGSSGELLDGLTTSPG